MKRRECVYMYTYMHKHSLLFIGHRLDRKEESSLFARERRGQKSLHRNEGP